MLVDAARARPFVRESNMIEGIRLAPTRAHVAEHLALFALEHVTLEAVCLFVHRVAGATLRDQIGMNVSVGGHIPPPGGLFIREQLRLLLADIDEGRLSRESAHRAYETLHPFMDGNGRSGRAIWAWQSLRDGRDPFALGFLHAWYYDTLQGGRE